MKVDKRLRKSILFIFLPLLLLVILFTEARLIHQAEIQYIVITSTIGPMVDKFPVQCVKIFYVLDGDTLDSIALNYAISKELIMKYNQLANENISSGMVLYIPLYANMPTMTLSGN